MHPIPFKYPKCEKETQHSVSYKVATDFAGTLTAICTECKNISISLPITIPRGSKAPSLKELLERISAMGNYKRQKIKNRF